MCGLKTDKEYDPPPAESNLLNIDVIQSHRNVDAKANGKDEIFVGIGWGRDLQCGR